MRIIAAVLLPLIVPLVISEILWALPGDPIDIMCPPGLCTGQAQMAERLCMDEGAGHFYTCWLSNAVSLDFGRSLRVAQGEEVWVLLRESLPTTALLVGAALVPVFTLSTLASANLLPRRMDFVWQAVGLVPSVILSLLAAAYVTIKFGAGSEFVPNVLRLIFGALVLASADGTLAGAVVGTRSVFDEEIKARYIQIAMLRGESTFLNALPNVTPALIGQFRGRILHIMSGAVIVEVVLDIAGLGDLLWDGTLLQDFPVVLAAAFAFSLMSGAMLFVQALAEVAVEMHIRRAPSVPLDATPAVAA
jgi:peptide/nickel transport system permease protein